MKAAARTAEATTMMIHTFVPNVETMEPMSLADCARNVRRRYLMSLRRSREG